MPHELDSVSKNIGNDDTVVEMQGIAVPNSVQEYLYRIQDTEQWKIAGQLSQECPLRLSPLIHLHTSHIHKLLPNGKITCICVENPQEVSSTENLPLSPIQVSLLTILREIKP